MKVREIATLHESTVQNAEALAKVYRLRSGHQHRTATHYVKVDQRVWKTAMRLAGNDPTRIVVVHATEVIVTNHSARKANR